MCVCAGIDSSLLQTSVPTLRATTLAETLWIRRAAQGGDRSPPSRPFRRVLLLDGATCRAWNPDRVQGARRADQPSCFAGGHAPAHRAQRQLVLGSFPRAVVIDFGELGRRARARRESPSTIPMSKLPSSEGSEMLNVSKLSSLLRSDLSWLSDLDLSVPAHGFVRADRIKTGRASRFQ